MTLLYINTALCVELSFPPPTKKAQRYSWLLWLPHSNVRNCTLWGKELKTMKGGMCILEPKKYDSPNNSVFVTAKSLLLYGIACCFLCKARKYLLLLTKNQKKCGQNDPMLPVQFYHYWNTEFYGHIFTFML